MLSDVPRIGSVTAGGSMLQGVQQALDAMSWLKASDTGMIVLAVKYAEQIDAADAAGDVRAVGYLGQQLHGVLRSLGGSPAERKALNIESGANGKLAELRAARADRERRSKAVDPSSSGVDS
jgi:hypothetical protein